MKLREKKKKKVLSNDVHTVNWEKDLSIFATCVTQKRRAKKEDRKKEVIAFVRENHVLYVSAPLKNGAFSDRAKKYLLLLALTWCG